MTVWTNMCWISMQWTSALHATVTHLKPDNGPPSPWHNCHTPAQVVTQLNSKIALLELMLNELMCSATDIAFCCRNTVKTINVGQNLVSKTKAWPVISWVQDPWYAQHISGISKIFTTNKCRHFTSHMMVKPKVSSWTNDTPWWNENGPFENVSNTWHHEDGEGIYPQAEDLWSSSCVVVSTMKYCTARGVTGAFW